jgi:hypothetical protein
MPMAWLMAAEDESIQRSLDSMHEGPNEQTINYWALRLSPFLEDKGSGREFYFANCNRTGTEQRSKFAGSSCALEFIGGSVSLLGAMGRQEAIGVFHL